jgi:hypothetical protein
LKNQIFIINGSGTSGKDTFVQLAQEIFNKNFNVYNISSVTRIKQALRLLGWDGISKFENDRKFMSILKILSDHFYNHSEEYMLSEWRKFQPNYLGFFHIREPEKIESFKNQLKKYEINPYTILVKRDNINSFNNRADQNVENYDYDFIIENNGSFAQLQDKCFNLINEVL